MPTEWTRRTFLCNATWLSLGGALAGAAAEQASPEPTPTVEDWFPHQDPKRVQEVVGASHGKFERVRELVEASPALAKASWDWGFGDWESALGAASHTGNHDIARFLIDKGARPSLFSAAMLGQLSVVRAFVETSPGVQRVLGPHGITLLSHAKAGGESAQGVLEYLEALGDADPRSPAQPLSEEQRSKYMGRYAFEAGAKEKIEVYEGKQGLMIRRGDQPGIRLTHLGDHAFHPAGAHAVRIRFTMDGERAREVAVYDPVLLMRARRVAD